MTPGIRAAVLYASSMLVLFTGMTALVPTAPVSIRLVFAHAALTAAIALFIWALSLDIDGPRSFFMSKGK